MVESVRVIPLIGPVRTPFRIATGQHDRLENVAIQVRLAEGVSGWGEAGVAPHITGETPDRTLANLRLAADDLENRDLSHFRDLCLDARRHFPANPSGLAALEMALLDAVARAGQFPFWRFFGDRPRVVRTDITVVIGSTDEAAAAARRFHRRGFRVFKVKIGSEETTDLERIAAVVRHAPGARILLDANQAFDTGRMLGFLAALRRRHIQPCLLEQPVPRHDWEGLAKLTRDGGVPVCADESIRTLADVAQAVRTRAVGVVNLKFAKSGIAETFEMARLARAGGLKLMLGAMMESALAITAAAHFAAGFGGFDFVDLDTVFFLQGPLGRSPYLDASGQFDFRQAGPGIGVVPRFRER